VHIPIVLTALLVSILSSPGRAVSSRSVTTFDLLEDGSLIVDVTIGGTGPYRFLLDTGSSRTVISNRLWQTLRRPVVARTVMVTPAGRDLALIVRLDGFGVGPLRPVTLDAAVMAADRYAAGQRVDGLIGQDVLAGAIYTIDYRARTIQWHAADDPLAGIRLPLKVTDHRVLVVLPQREGDQHPLSLIPDSGSDAFVVFAHATERLRFTPLDVDVLRSLSGVKLVRRVRIDELIVGNARLRDAPAVIVDTGESAEIMGDGLLPLHVFSRVTFNVRERYLIVETPLNAVVR
jgi:predicted aspartyl protease